MHHTPPRYPFRHFKEVLGCITELTPNGCGLNANTLNIKDYISLNQLLNDSNDNNDNNNNGSIMRDLRRWLSNSSLGIATRGIPQSTDAGMVTKMFLSSSSSSSPTHHLNARKNVFTTTPIPRKVPDQLAHRSSGSFQPGSQSPTRLQIAA
jgi:hypothetical protein